MKTVVVFGATGSVGAYVCLWLSSEGYEVIAVGHRSSDNGFFPGNGIRYVAVDVCHVETFGSLPLTDVYAVVNLAAKLPARMSGYHPQQYIDVNMTGALNILNYSVRAGAAKVVYSQSMSEIIHLCGMSTPIPSDVSVSFPLDNDHTVYSITKNAAVSMLEHYAHRYGFRYYVLRFPNIYLYHPNPYYYVDGEKRWQGYRLMIRLAMSGSPISIWGNPGKVRDIVYVKDCCQIIEKCIAVDDAESGTYNVGTGIGTTLEEQVRGIVEVFSPREHPSLITYDPHRPDSTEYIFDISKTVNNLGYVPRYDYMAYLTDFKREMQEQRFQLLWGMEQW